MNNLLLFLSFFLLFSITKSAIVSTSLGQIDGDQIGSFHLFKHIPLAKPPIGKLRFQKPEPPEKWTGVRNAKAYGPACISNSSVSTSPQKWIDEDCLHINIFTSDKCLKSKDCAVVTYFHGGGLMYDSAVMFNDTYLLGTFVNQDVIIAIPAFRLGIFSHFVVEDQSIAPTNLALYDILLGVEFVKNEIHNFGGNNQKNTIMGHSYGGSIVNILTFSSKINHDLSLFQQSICMSSGHDFETLEIQIQKTNRFAKHAGCTVPSIIEKKMTTRQSDLYRMKCLQNKDALELLRVQRLLEDEGYPTYGYLVQREPLIQEIPYQEFMKSPKKIPMLTGCTRYEMDHSPAPKPIGQALGFENPEEVYMKFRKDWDDEVYEFGNHSDETQAIMVQVRVRVNNLLSKNVPAYLYEYTYPKHARHTDDLFYLMGVHRFEKDENEIELGKVYETIFMNFAKFGDPKEGFELANAENESYYEVYWDGETGERPQMKTKFEEKIINYWLKDMVEYDKHITELKNQKISIRKPVVRFYEESSKYHQYSYMTISILLIFTIFLTGYLFGRCCCVGNQDRNLYIQLDGSNIPTGHIVKNF